MSDIEFEAADPAAGVLSASEPRASKTSPGQVLAIVCVGICLANLDLFIVNMIRQPALAIGVAIFVTVIGTPATLGERVAAFHRGWWVIAVVTLMGLVPTYFYIHRRKQN
jgi:hypothetical protein